MKVPARTNDLVEVAKVKVLKGDPFELKFAIRTVARENSLYHQPVELVIGGRPVSLPNAPKTLGQWLFGLPDYAGHYRQRVEGDEVVILAPDLPEMKELLYGALQKLKEEGLVEWGAR
ncbi:hypothetical protein Theam_1773 (plasmid) [Thermovibrio ammonificans HB-1]|uniref:Uncharacterized protein n=1 Tax=Thermovibrio ammonificans (strain DSM 15698 / JCM 12110 / HB-1) TaxID=648996 RepID=E8T708_THEA1|nr:hypothetical protein [Thermovibrio ammonificans]ADU97729.1 hypothetical protein Theam_1773 [Thermovibrio ammonificans HB-1]